MGSLEPNFGGMTCGLRRGWCLGVPIILRDLWEIGCHIVSLNMCWLNQWMIQLSEAGVVEGVRGLGNQ